MAPAPGVDRHSGDAQPLAISATPASSSTSTFLPTAGTLIRLCRWYSALHAIVYSAKMMGAGDRLHLTEEEHVTMTMTANPAPVPAWLNLSAIVGDELIAELSELTTAVEAISEEHDDLFQRCQIAVVAVEKSINAAESDVDGLFDLLIRVTGGKRLNEALLRLGSQADAARGDSSPLDSLAPEWGSVG